jgi:hypothetical protein
MLYPGRGAAAEHGVLLCSIAAPCARTRCYTALRTCSLLLSDV